MYKSLMKLVFILVLLTCSTSQAGSQHVSLSSDAEGSRSPLSSSRLFVGCFPIPDAGQTAVHGDYLFAADYSLPGIFILDITDPEYPSLVNTLILPNPVERLTLSGNYLYAACGIDGMCVVDISDPENPAIASMIGGMQSCKEIKISGDFAYVAGGSTGLHVIDISDPTAPHQVGNCDGYDYLYRLSVAGDIVYASDEDYGITVIDVTDSSHPFRIGGYQTPAGYGGWNTVAGDHLYMTGAFNGPQFLEHDLMVLDISDPSHPFLAGVLETPGNMGWEIVVSGDNLYTFEHEGSTLYLLSIDISDPNNPYLLNRYSTPSTPIGGSLTFSGEYAFLGAGTGGLQVLKPYERYGGCPILSGTTSLSYAGQTAVHGDYLFVSDITQQRIQVLDIRDPENPVMRTSLPVNNLSSRLIISGDYLYASCGYSGMCVVNISNPLNPFIVAVVIGNMQSCKEIKISGDYAYVAGGGSGLHVIDISNPASPYQVGNCAGYDYLYRLSVAGDIVYASDEDYGITVIDVSDPHNPARIGSYHTPASYGGWNAVAGDHLYMTGAFNGPQFLEHDLMVLDISDPTNPFLVGVLETPGNMGWEMVVSGDILYTFEALDDLMDLLVIDISDPTSPDLICRHSTAHQPSDGAITLFGEYAFMGRGSGGLETIKIFYKAENPIATQLQSFAAAFDGSCIEVTWLLSSIEDHVTFEVLRAEAESGRFSPLEAVTLDKENMSFTFLDKTVVRGNTYIYRVEIIEDGRRSLLFETEPVKTPGLSLMLYQNNPNPFNPATTIRYDLPCDSRVVLDIFNVSGSRIARLVDEFQPRGTHRVNWNGLDGNNRQVSSGVYFYVLRAGKDKIVRKLVLMR